MTLSPEKIAEINALLASWRQGDVVIGNTIPFVHLADLAVPTTSAAEQLAADGVSGVEIVPIDPGGLVVLTQTCDLIRTCADRPYVEVSPLVTVPSDKIDFVRRNRIPRYLPLPALDDASLAGDLDRVMTVEKGLLSTFTGAKVSGVNTDGEALILAETLGRKRTRAALPDDFVAAVGRMRNRINDKHDKDTQEGDFLRRTKEIRVLSLPNWTADTIEVEFLFIFERGAVIPRDAGEWIEQLMARVTTDGRIIEVRGRAVGLDELSAASYLDSHRLDLDHLSQAGGEAELL